jgi:Putative glycosyl hydrolase domain
MVLEPADRNAYYRNRRRRARRKRRVRVLAVLGLGVVAALTTGAALVVRSPDGDGEQAGAARVAAASPTSSAEQKARPAFSPRPAPLSMRGVHVTMLLASIPGKIEQYLGLRGLNAVELDLKDEAGEVAFSPSTVPLAGRIGAARGYYSAPRIARKARRAGVYLIGRIVCFQDPMLAEGRPALALRRPDGSLWRNVAGHAWVSPYRREVWRYLVDVAVAAARRGFDEIQFDYVRFPSDGQVSEIVYPGRTSTTPAPGWVIAGFLQYARKRLEPLGVRVSADVFGLSATRDVGVAQVPRRISRYLDAIYPMVYPSHYNAGEYGLPDPNADPGRTVASSLADFTRELAGRDTDLIPWLQDFSLGRTYTLADVQAQIDAAAAAGSAGFLLWNPLGVYTTDALTYEARQAPSAATG